MPTGTVEIEWKSETSPNTGLPRSLCRVQIVSRPLVIWQTENVNRTTHPAHTVERLVLASAPAGAYYVRPTKLAGLVGALWQSTSQSLQGPPAIQVRRALLCSEEGLW